MPIDVVRIDAIYNPVRRANFAVAETRVGQRTDYDRLTLTVETNGTITPEEAVSYAAALAQTHFQYFVGFGSHTSAPVTPGGEAAGGDAVRLAELQTPIDDLELSVRSVNSLKNSNIRSLGDLVRQTESQILQVKNFGKKSLQEIADLLERKGLNFGMRYEETPDGVRILDWGTPPSRAAANAPDDVGGVGDDHARTGRPDGSSGERASSGSRCFRNLAISLIEHGADRDDRGQGQGAAAVRREADHQGASGHAARAPSRGARRARAA